MQTSQWTNVVIAGLGGQGVIRASDILAEAAFLAGLDVKKSEIHGMSQRGGSVSSDIRFGKKIFSPVIPIGETDYLLVLEASQTEINLPRLKKQGTLLEPKNLSTVTLLNPKAINTALLGLLSARMELIPLDAWENALRRYFPEKHIALNLEAFDLGRKAGKELA